MAAVLQISGREDGLQDMWGGPGQRYGSSAGIITREHASLLKRLLARGITPRIELSLQGGFAAKPVQEHNVVADFPGSEPGGEMVILGAHLDSWDLSSGASDNGAGVVAMLEVMRAMRAAGRQPKRTLRIVLFSGEEQGLLGSKAYVAAHHAELARIQAVLVLDAGSGRILAYPDMNVEAWYAGLAAALKPAAAMGEIDVHYAVGMGSDQDSFFRQGIPAFAPLQGNAQLPQPHPAQPGRHHRPRGPRRPAASSASHRHPRLGAAQWRTPAACPQSIASGSRRRGDHVKVSATANAAAPIIITHSKLPKLGPSRSRQSTNASTSMAQPAGRKPLRPCPCRSSPATCNQ